MSAMLGMTVLIPFPRPSTLVSRRGILYRCKRRERGERMESATRRLSEQGMRRDETNVELVL